MMSQDLEDSSYLTTGAGGLGFGFGDIRKGGPADACVGPGPDLFLLPPA